MAITFFFAILELFILHRFYKDFDDLHQNVRTEIVLLAETNEQIEKSASGSHGVDVFSFLFIRLMEIALLAETNEQIENKCFLIFYLSVGTF